MKSKKILCTLALTTVLLEGVLLTTVDATTISSHRIAGNNRYETSEAISQTGWVNSDTVVLANGEQFPDALCTGPLAKKYNAPILLTSSQNISDDTINELKRLKAKNIIIVGGTGAISIEIENKLKSEGYSTDRIGGENRYETSAMIAARLDKPSAVIIASGESFPDALSVSTVASKLGMPILLSPKDGLSDYAKNYISKNNITKTYIVGGTGVLSSDIEKAVPSPIRLSGNDRFGTNLAIIKAFDSNLNYDNVYVTSDQSFTDALSGAVLASNSDSPIILSNQALDKNINDYLKSKMTLNSKAIALGGTAVVSDSLIENLMNNKAAISVAKNYDTQGSFSGGAINGSVIISASGVSLKDTTINGDLLIASTVGDGTVNLDNVVVTGKIIVNGGGDHSVYFHNMTVQVLELDKPTGNNVRIATDATSSVTSTVVNSNGILDATNTSKAGNVTINKQSNVNLKGNFDAIQVNGNGSNVSLQSGNIKILDVTSTAIGAKVDIGDTTTVNTLNVNAPISVTGKGVITAATINANGTTLETKPTNLSIATGISSTVGGETKDENTNPITSSSVADLSDGGNHNGNYVILTGGTFGDSIKTTSISGNVYINDTNASTSDKIVLQNMNIVGSLNVDFGAGTVTLNNVTVNGINVSNVGSNSLHVKGNSFIGNLTVNDPNNDAHIVVEDNAMIEAATVFSGANLEVAATATNAQPFSNITVAPKASPTASNQIMLTGAFDTVNVTSAAKVVLAPNSEIKTQIIAKAPLEFTAPDTAKVSKVDIEPSHPTDTFVLNGNLENVNVSAVSNVQVQSGTVKVSSNTNAAVNVMVAQNATVNTVSGSTLTVTGSGAIVTREKSAEAKITLIRLGNAKIYTSSINDLPQAISAKKLLENILVSAFANVQVVDSAGNPVSNDTLIDNTMKLKVTAENGITINNYTLNFVTLPTFAANYPKAATGLDSSKSILITTKANQPGRVYMVAVPSGAPAPTTAQVKIGTDATGKFVANAIKDLQIGVENTQPIIVKDDNTQYDIYIVLADLLGRLQLKPTKLTANSPAVAPDKIFKSTQVLPDINITYSKDKPDLNLPTEVTITTNDGASLQAKVNWNEEPKNELGGAIFTGKLELPMGVVNPNNVSLMVTQKVVVSFTLDALINEISFAKNMLNIPVGTNVGDCSDQTIKDALLKTLDEVKVVAENTSATKEEINNAFYKLKQAEEAVEASMITGLMPSEASNAVPANSEFHQAIDVMIAGPGKFIENLSPSNISLGGDFAGLAVKSVHFANINEPWKASIELQGNLSLVSGTGTITVNAAGWNGPIDSHAIEAKIAVTDPNFINLIWPTNIGFTYDFRNIKLMFDSELQAVSDWSQMILKDSNGVQIPITGVYNTGLAKELEIQSSLIENGQYTLTIPENTLVDINGTKYNKAINFTFKIQLPNIDIAVLKDEVLFSQNMVNIPVGNNAGDCPKQSIKDAFANALTNAEVVVGKINATQEEINKVFYELREAHETFEGSIMTGLMPTESSNTVPANNTFHQTIGIRIAGLGKFIDNINPSNISLGGDFAGLTVQSVSFINKDEPWQINVELQGNLSAVSGTGTITVNAAGWNSMSGAHDITANIKVIDPNALNLVWPMDNNFTYNNKCINLGFDNDIQIPSDWSKMILKDSNGVQVPITGVYRVGSTKELGIEASSIKNGQYTLTIPENTLVDISGVKHNKAISITFKIELANVDIATLNNEISFVQNMANIPVGNNVGDCQNQSAKDAFISTLNNAQTVAKNTNATQEEINKAFYELHEAQQVFQKSMITGLMPAQANNVVSANSTFHQTIEVMVAGPGSFVENLNSSNISLGGDFAGLTVQSVSFADSNERWKANIELQGNLSAVSGAGTITVNAAGWNSMSGAHDITANIKVIDPNALNLAWPMDNNFIYNNKCINLGFDNDIQVPSDWSKMILKDSNGVQVPITGVYRVGSTKELGIEASSIKNGQYTLTIPENTLVDISGVKHNKAISITFKIELANVDIATLNNEISFVQNMTNIPVGNNVGDCQDQSLKDAMINALTNAQTVAANNSSTQEEITNAFYDLRQAQQAFQASILTGLMSTEINNAVTANSSFHQTIGVRIAGPGAFIKDLSPSNIILGGDFAGLTVQSISFADINQPWEAKIELQGNLIATSKSGTITVNAAGWNSLTQPHDITATIAVNPIQ